MQERQHDFVVADQLDAFAAGAFENVDARAVLGLFVEVDRDEAIEVVVYRLRKKLIPTGTKLVTLRGLGYLLKVGA